MNRIAEYDGEKELFAMASMILSLPQREVHDVLAITVLPGLGERERIHDAVCWWETKDAKAEFFLYPGMNLRERTAIAVDIEILKKDFGLKRTNNVIIRAHAEHTKDQADWIAKQMQKFDIRGNTALICPPYHMVRAYLTLVKSFLDIDIKSFIIPVPTVKDPSVIIPEVQVNSWDMIPGEVNRIKKYQEKGDVATYKELKEYFARQEKGLW